MTNRPPFRNLSYDNPATQKDELLKLAEFAPDKPLDRYGVGITDRLEERLCALLGHEAALFMPSGKAAQNIALKIWCQRQGHDRVALHPRAHPEEWEAKALGEVFRLQSTALGLFDRQTTLGDLKAIREPVGVAAVELALRPLGCIAVAYDELKAMSEHARETGIPFHADAARLWDVQPHYGVPHAEIASHFDTLYVSMYKILRGFAGGVLLGPEDFIAEARIWQLRLGQKLYRQFPYALAALRGLDEMLHRIPGFFDRARVLAEEIARLSGVYRVNPLPPHTPSFQIVFEADPVSMTKARDLTAEKTGIWMFDHVFPSPYAGLSMMEAHVGSSAMEMSTDEILGAFLRFGAFLEDPPALAGGGRHL